MNNKTLLQQLRTRLGEPGLRRGEDTRPRDFEDVLGVRTRRPLALLRPADTAPVSAAWRLCHPAGLPIVTEGGRSIVFGKPIIAAANFFTEVVPGHGHLRNLGQLGAREIEAVEAADGVAKEFNTIAVDDGIAAGHDGMLYSLPSRDLIAEAIEYMVNASCADALVCIGNCDKIPPGMLTAAMRLNLPTVFVGGGPMEAGQVQHGHHKVERVSVVESYIAIGRPGTTAEASSRYENAACPNCGFCSDMFTATSMNGLTEALGLSLPGNGSLLATPADRRACESAMRMDIAMGASTDTLLHLLAAAHEGEGDFTLADIDRISRATPHLCKVSPSSPDYFMQDVHRAGGVDAMFGELDRLSLLNTRVGSVHASDLASVLKTWDVQRNNDPDVKRFFRAAPGGVRATQAFSQEKRYPSLDLDRSAGCIRDGAHACSADGGLAVLQGNLAPEGGVLKTAAVHPAMRAFKGRAIVFDSEIAARDAIEDGSMQPGHAAITRDERPRGGPGMREMCKPAVVFTSRGLHLSGALITDGRCSGADSGLAIGHVSPEAAAGGAVRDAARLARLEALDARGAA